MMKRSNWPLVIVWGVAGGFGLLNMHSADAQGLFRRLQDRVQSRLEPIAPTTPPAQQSARPDATDPAAQRLSPIDPDQTASDPPGNRATPLGSRLGGSILSRSSRNNPAQGGDPANSSVKPTMGIRVLPATEGTPGLKVAGIRPGSLADEAGLRTDDLILAVDGTATPTIESIAGILQNRKVGDSIRATVLRGETASVVVIPLLDPAKLAEAAASQASTDSDIAQAGQALPVPTETNATETNPNGTSDIASSPIDFGVEVEGTRGTRGVVITSVRPDSAAATAGLKAGDRIVSINGRLMLDEAAFQRDLTRYQSGDELSINAVRDETLNTYDVVLQSRLPEQLDGVAKTIPQPVDRNDVPATSQPAEAAGPARGNSVLGGLGSVIGGLFKGPPGENAGAADAVDTMELGDDEPIQRVGFDEEIKTDSQPLQTDPPSIEELTPPSVESLSDTITLSPADATKSGTATPSGDEKDQIIQALREEIRRLQERLNELEKERS